MSTVIRAIQKDDLAEVIKILNPYILNSAITFDTQAYDVESRMPWFEQFNSHSRYQCLVAVNQQGVVAYANSAPLKQKAAYDTSVEVSIYSNGAKGLGSQLYEALFARLAEQDIHRAHALITVPNEPSINLHKKFGFYEVGVLNQAGRKFDQYYDVCWMEKRLR